MAKVGDGTVLKHHEQSSIDLAMNRYNKERMIRVFEPSEEQRAKLQELLFQSEDFWREHWTIRFI